MENNSLTFFDTVRRWLLFNYKTLLLSVLLAIACFPKYDLIYSSGIDEAIPWAFNYFANGHYDLTTKLAFPHGRLAFLLYPLPMGNNIFVAIFITLLCSIWFCVNMFKLSEFKRKGNYLVTSLLLLIILSTADIQLLIIGLTFSNVLLYYATGKSRNYILAIFFAVFGFYLKSYCGIICSSIIGVEFLYILFVTKKFSHSLLAIVLFPVFFYTGWLAIYGSLTGSFTFIISQLELSSNNSEAVSMYNRHNWWFLAICLVTLVTLPLHTKDKPARHFSLIMLPALFAAWKHAMSRSDSIHLSGFISFEILLVFSFWLLIKEVKARVIVLGIISIVFFIFSIADSGNMQTKEITVFKPGNLYRMLFKYKETAKEKNYMSHWSTSYVKLPDTLLKIIGKQTVDVFPWNSAIIAINELNWKPRPVIHSYAAYTKWLDEQDAKFIDSDEAPQFMIWEVNKTRDSVIRKMDGIDLRYLLNDEPKMILKFFSNYSLKYKSASYLLYEKRAVKQTYTVSTITPEETLKNDDWFDVPVCEDDCVMRVKFKVGKSFLGKIKSTFYKGEAFFLTYHFSDRSTYTHRIVPENAAEGAWIYPLVLNPDNNLIERRAEKIKVICTDNRMVDEEYKIVFEKIKFSNTNHTTFLQNSFNKTVK